MKEEESLNVFGEPLESSGIGHVTGLFREGTSIHAKKIGFHT